jgi:death on curing protein
VPAFLTTDEILAIHADQIARYGGAGELRDVALLESALAMPQASFDGELLHPTLEEMAAAYLFHLVKNHPFVDGNKRTGLMAAIAFLGLNGRRLVAEPGALGDLVLGVAEGQRSKADVAVFLRENSEATP